MPHISRLQTIQIINQRKAFCSEKISQCSSPWKKTVDILITSRNGDRKIMHPVTVMSRPLMRIKKTETAKPVPYTKLMLTTF